jgi:hypothetical protein
MELPVDQIERARGRLVRRGGPDRLATHKALQPEKRHQASDAVASDLEAFAVELEPDLPGAVDAEVLLVDADDLD